MQMSMESQNYSITIEELSFEEYNSRRKSSKCSTRRQHQSTTKKSALAAVKNRFPQNSSAEYPKFDIAGSENANNSEESKTGRISEHTAANFVIEERQGLSLPCVQHIDWPGHCMDVALPGDQNSVSTTLSEYSPSLEGHLIVELITQLTFLWGLSPSPLNTMRQSIKAEISSFNPPPQNEPLMDAFEVYSDDIEDESKAEALDKRITSDAVGEIKIEEYTEQNKPKRRVFQKETKIEDEEDDFMDETPKPSRMRLLKLRKSEKSIDSAHSQLEIVRKLIFDDYYRPRETRSVYLSHIILFIGASITTSKFACSFVRPPRQSPESDVSTSTPKSTEMLPKSRAEDAWIRSTLRGLLQKDIGNPLERGGKSKFANRVSILVCYSALPSLGADASSLDSPLPSYESMIPIRVAPHWFTKWNAKKPMKTIRIGEMATNSHSNPVYTARLGDMIALNN